MTEPTEELNVWDYPYGERSLGAREYIKDWTMEKLWEHLRFLTKIEQFRNSDLAMIEALISTIYDRTQPASPEAKPSVPSVP